VYSFGDLGRRLHAFYYVPGETIESLTGRFEVSVSYQWVGCGMISIRRHGKQPGNWLNYDGNATAMSTVSSDQWEWLGGGYGYNTDTPTSRAALSADLVDIENYQGNMKFNVKLDGGVSTLTALHTAAARPRSAAGSGLDGLSMLGGFGLLAGLRKKLRRSPRIA